MVRLFIHSLFLTPFWAACPPTFDVNDVHFTSRPEGQKRGPGANAAAQACEDMVAAIKNDPWYDNAQVDKEKIKADCEQIADKMMREKESDGVYYDEAWNQVKTCNEAVASFKDDGWYTCSGLDDVCFDKKGPASTWTQTRFPLPNGKSEMCSKLAAALAPADGPLAYDLGYPASKVETDCLNAISKQTKITNACDTVQCPGDKPVVKTVEYCTIDTLDQQCATALAENDPVEINLRHGCKCHKECTGHGDLKACVQQLLGKTSKDFFRVEVVVYDETHQDHSVNHKVKDLDEAAKCLACRKESCPSCSIQFNKDHVQMVNGCGSGDDRCGSI